MGATIDHITANALALSESDAAQARRAAFEDICSLLGEIGKAEPGLIVPQLALARLDAREGNVAGALSRLNGLLQACPGHASILLKIAFLLRDQPSLDDPGAQDLLQTPDALARLFVPPIPAGLRAGLSFQATERSIHRADQAVRERGAWGEALGWLCGELLWVPEAKLPERAPKLIGRMACALDAAGMSAEAAELSLYGVRRFPADQPLRCVAARMACQAKRWNDADQALEPVLKAAPWNRVARGYQALGLLGRGQLDEGWALLKKWGMQHTPEYMAEVSLRLAEFDPRLSGDGPPAPPEDLRPPRENGALAKLVAKVEQALSAESTILAEEPRRSAIYLENLALLDAGAAAGPAPSELGPSQTMWHLLRGYSLLKLGRCAEGRRHFAAALVVEPSNLLLATGHGETALFSGDAQTAVESYLEVIPDGPNDYGAYFHLGLAYAKLGREEEARAALRVAFTSHFDDSFLVSLAHMRAAIHEARSTPAAATA